MPQVKFWSIAIVFVLAMAAGAACGGDDDDGSADSNRFSTIIASGTEVPSEEDASPTATRVAGPDPAPTKTSGTLILATTTSFQDSGLMDVLVKMFEDESGYDLTPVAVGSGQAIAQGARGDADVVLAHSPAAEAKMVTDGDGIERSLVMHNDFVIVGPAGDPAGVQQQETLDDVMRAMAGGTAGFISRGDDSGTHTLEKKLWAAVQIEPKGQAWYSETGQGMGATLQVANQRSAYTLSDRGTYLAQQKNLDLEILFFGAPGLINPYHVIVVNPAKHPGVNVTAARAFAAFLLRADVQQLIGEFGVAEFGEQLFVPDAGKPEPTQ